MVANKYAFLQITRRRFLNEWEAFKKVITRRNIRRRITIPLTLSNLKLLRRITRTEHILHRDFTRRHVAIQDRVASDIGISQSTFSVKVLNLCSGSRRQADKRECIHSVMLRNREGGHRMFIGLLKAASTVATPSAAIARRITGSRSVLVISATAFTCPAFSATRAMTAGSTSRTKATLKSGRCQPGISLPPTTAVLAGNPNQCALATPL